MLPMAATMMPTARLAPTLTARFGSRWMCAAGLLIIAAALAVIAQVSHTSPYWLLATGVLVLGVGMGCAMPPATSNITAALPPAKQGVASAINDLSREVGGAIGIAVIGSVMTVIYRSHLTVPGVPAGVLGQARNSVAVAAHIGGPVAAKADTAFIDGVHIALYTAAGAAALAAIVVFLLLSRHTGRATASTSHLPPRSRSRPDLTFTIKHAVLHGDGNQPLPWSTAQCPRGNAVPGHQHRRASSGLKPSVASRQRSSTFPYIVPA